MTQAQTLQLLNMNSTKRKRKFKTAWETYIMKDVYSVFLFSFFLQVYKKVHNITRLLEKKN